MFFLSSRFSSSSSSPPSSPAGQWSDRSPPFYPIQPQVSDERNSDVSNKCSSFANLLQMSKDKKLSIFSPASKVFYLALFIVHDTTFLLHTEKIELAVVTNLHICKKAGFHFKSGAADQWFPRICWLSENLDVLQIFLLLNLNVHWKPWYTSPWFLLCCCWAWSPLCPDLPPLPTEESCELCFAYKIVVKNVHSMYIQIHTHRFFSFLFPRQLFQFVKLNQPIEVKK